jgi:hypothetical protein
VSFAAITFCIASRVFIIVVVVYFVIDSVQKLLDTPSYNPDKSYARCSGGGGILAFLRTMHILL